MLILKISLADAATPNPAPVTAAIVNPPDTTGSIVMLLPAVIVTSSLVDPSFNLRIALLPLSTALNV